MTSDACWEANPPLQPGDRRNGTSLRKHYLPATNVAGGINYSIQVEKVTMHQKVLAYDRFIGCDQRRVTNLQSSVTTTPKFRIQLTVV